MGVRSEERTARQRERIPLGQQAPRGLGGALRWRRPAIPDGRYGHCHATAMSMPATPLLVFTALFLASCVSSEAGIAGLARQDSPLASQSPGRQDDSSERRVAQRADHRQPWELALGGAGVSNDKVEAGSAQVAGSIGYYLNENLELSFRQNASYANAGPDSPEAWNNTSRAAIDIHLPIGCFVPYVGVNLGYAYGDSIPDSLVGGPEAGAKIYIKSDVFVLLAVEYQAFFDSDDSADSVFDDAQLVYGLGLGVRF